MTPQIKGLDLAGLVPLERIEPESLSGGEDEWLHAAVLCGPDQEIAAWQFDRAVKAALALQQRPRVQAYVFFNEARVAVEGGERRYRRAREEGVVFVRLAPGGLKAEDGGALLNWIDPVLGEAMSLAPDVLACGQAFQTGLPAFLQNPNHWPPICRIFCPKAPRGCRAVRRPAAGFTSWARPGAPLRDRTAWPRRPRLWPICTAF